jgi:hypothetical protein
MYTNRFIIMLSVILLLALALGPLPGSVAHASGSAVYVAPAGSDANDCLSSASPCATINSALTKAISAGIGTIDVAIGTYTRTSGTEVVSLASLPIGGNITLSGGWDTGFSAQSGTSTIDGENTRQGINVPGSRTITIESFTIENGYTIYSGGGITMGNDSTLTINNSIITNNHANSYGGGLYSAGTLTVTNSTFSNNNSNTGAGIYHVPPGNPLDSPASITTSTFANNHAIDQGGGLDNVGMMTITNSTFSGNYSSANFGQGGGIYNSGTLTIANSTFSGNSAPYKGGGIHNESNTLTIINSTFSGNGANSSGGGLLIYGGTLNYANTIIANSTSGGDCVLGSGTIGTNTNNLVEDGSCSAFLSGDPNLAALADNGGPTETLALMAGSAAIDAGDNTVCDDNPGPNNLDQRGLSRPIDGDSNSSAICDIGAYEYQDATAPTVDSFAATSPSTSLNISITAFSASDLIGVTGYKITESSTPPSAGASGWTGSAPGTYTVGGDGSYTLYPWAKDAAGNVSGVYTSASVLVDTTAPTVSSSVRVGANPTNAASVDFTVTFSESVSGVDATDFSLTTTGVTGASVSGVTGSGTTYTVSVNTGSGDGTIRLDVLDDDSITDVVGNTLGGGLTSGESYTVDKTAPDTSIDSQPSDPSNTSAAVFTFSGTDTGGSGVASFACDVDSGGYNACTSPKSLTSLGDGSHTFSVKAIDNAGNTDASPASYTWTIDTSAPTITINDPNTSTAQSKTITASASDGTLTMSNTTGSICNGTLTFGAYSSQTFLSESDNGTKVCYKAVDSAGNIAYSLSNAIMGIDTSAPTTLSFVRQTPSGNLTNADTLIFRTTFSEAVTGVDMADFGVNGTTTATVTGVSSVSSSVYDVTISGGNLASFNGLVGLNFNSPSITDLASNALANAEPATDQTYTLDNGAPTVVSSVRVNPSPTYAGIMQFTVTFSEPVSGVSTGDFSLTTTGGITGASVTSVTGGPTIYTVSVSTGSGGTLRLNVPNTASVSDLAGNALASLPFTSGQSYIVLKSTTFISLGAQDGWILESSETSGTGGTLNATAATFNLGDDATRKQYRGLLSFSTGSLPDNAVITEVTLRVMKSSVVGGGDPVSIFQGFMVDIKNGFFGTSALETTDFQTVASQSYGPLNNVLGGNWYRIALTSGKTYVNKLATSGGLTQIRLRFKLDDNNNKVANYLSLYSGNATAANRPQLLIGYYVP